MILVHAREPIPTRGISVFLAGPTPRHSEVPSWRPAAIEALTAQWTGPGPLTVFTPESRGGIRAAHYDDQVDWETTARETASAILFWIPRDLQTMPGFTTNVEFGLDVGTGRAVLGCPPDCPDPERNRYLIWIARRHGAPVCETLHDTVAAALTVANRGNHPPRPMSHSRPLSTMAAGGHPEIVCLCGSTQFKDEFARVNAELTKAGAIVLTPGVFGHSGDPYTAKDKAQLDDLHLRKIDLADRVLIINPGGYIGESTHREITYATKHNKPIRYLEAD